MSNRHKSYRRKAESEPEEQKPLLDEEGNPRFDEEGNPIYEDVPAEDPVEPEAEAHRVFMASIQQIACGIEELTKKNCPAPDAARICETVWMHQNGATIKGMSLAE